MLFFARIIKNMFLDVLGPFCPAVARIFRGWGLDFRGGSEKLLERGLRYAVLIAWELPASLHGLCCVYCMGYAGFIYNL